MKAIRAALLGLALATVAAAASAQNEQFIPMIGYWVGPYAPGGSGIFGGFIDYINMINARDGGVERRQAHLGEVRDRVQQRARRRVLRAAEEARARPAPR